MLSQICRVLAPTNRFRKSPRPRLPQYPDERCDRHWSHCNCRTSCTDIAIHLDIRTISRPVPVDVRPLIAGTDLVGGSGLRLDQEERNIGKGRIQEIGANALAKTRHLGAARDLPNACQAGSIFQSKPTLGLHRLKVLRPETSPFVERLTNWSRTANRYWFQPQTPRLERNRTNSPHKPNGFRLLQQRRCRRPLQTRGVDKCRASMVPL